MLLDEHHRYKPYREVTLNAQQRRDLEHICKPMAKRLVSFLSPQCMVFQRIGEYHTEEIQFTSHEAADRWNKARSRDWLFNTAEALFAFMGCFSQGKGRAIGFTIASTLGLEGAKQVFKPPRVRKDYTIEETLVYFYYWNPNYAPDRRTGVYVQKILKIINDTKTSTQTFEYDPQYTNMRISEIDEHYMVKTYTKR